MSGKSTVHETTVLNILRATNVTAPATIYVGTYTVDPTDAGGGTESTGGSYARQAITWTGAPSGSPRSITNSADILITMPASTVTAVGLFDASTAGNMLYWFHLAASVAFAAGDQARFVATTGIVVTED